MNQKSLKHMISVVFFVLILVGCIRPVAVPTTSSPALTPILPTATPLPATATSESATISGKLIGPDSSEPFGPHGPIAKAQIYLKFYQDENCEKLAESSKELSEQEKQQLEECVYYATTTSDTEGRYQFSDVTPGLHSLIIEWELSERPHIQGPFFIEFRDGFLVALKETVETPKRYFVRAVKSFSFSGEESMTIDFDFSKKPK